MVKFCYAAGVNDHEAYPLSLAAAPPEGWSYRATAVEFDATLGRPWCRFDARPGEWIHASSLIPTNGIPWVLDTDHVGFMIKQAQTSAEELGRSTNIEEIEERLVKDITGEFCRGVLAWSKASQVAFEMLCWRHGVTPPSVTQAYPGVVRPDLHAEPQSRELAAILQQLDRSCFTILAVDGQVNRGASKVPGRKNVSVAADVARKLRRDGEKVQMVVVGSMELIKVDADWLYMLPALSRPDLWRLYSEVDLLLFPSRQETFGYILMEAMMCGVCCLAAHAESLPAVPEIIEHCETGILVGFRDSKPYPELSGSFDVTQAVIEIKKLIADPEKRKSISQKASNLFVGDGVFSVRERNRKISKELIRI